MLFTERVVYWLQSYTLTLFLISRISTSSDVMLIE